MNFAELLHIFAHKRCQVNVPLIRYGCEFIKNLLLELPVLLETRDLDEQPQPCAEQISRVCVLAFEAEGHCMDWEPTVLGVIPKGFHDAVCERRVVLL